MKPNNTKNLQMTSQTLTWKAVKVDCNSGFPIPKPSPRWGHSNCIFNTQIAIFGGYANSKYLNDLWAFDTVTMKWREIQTTGEIPSERSNSTLHYDNIHNRLIVFGGGSDNRERYNDIRVLDMQTHQWKLIQISQKQCSPQERTYHSSQFIYPYLIVFGGEGVGDLDDLWVFDFNKQKWSEVIFSHEAVRPIGRRFHTSSMIGNQLFIIAGCHSKYRALNDIYSINLEKLINSDSIKDLEWQQRKINDQGFLSRWGHCSVTSGKNIYVFGGRFSTDLNDLLVLNTKQNLMKMVKVNTDSDSNPKPRRRASLNIVGSCLILLGGFNCEYFDDMHYINISEMNESNESKRKFKPKENMDSLKDCQVLINGRKINIQKGALGKYLGRKDRVEKFLRQIQQQQQEEDFLQMMESLEISETNNKLISKYLKDFIITSEHQRIEKMLGQQFSHLQKFSQHQKLLKLQNEMFDFYYQKTILNKYVDVEIMFVSQKNRHKIKCNKILLAKKSQFFSNLFSPHFNLTKQDKGSYQVFLPFVDSISLEILINYLERDVIVLNRNIDCSGWFRLFSLANYLILTEVETLIVNQLSKMVNNNLADKIFHFANKYKLGQLAKLCVRQSVLNNYNILVNPSNRYYCQSLCLNQFEIAQYKIESNPEKERRDMLKQSFIEFINQQKRNCNN